MTIAESFQTFPLIIPVNTNGDLDTLAAYVGATESIAEFERKTKALIDSTVGDRYIFQARVDQMWREKREWQEKTARLAREVLGR